MSSRFRDWLVAATLIAAALMLAAFAPPAAAAAPPERDAAVAPPDPEAAAAPPDSNAAAAPLRVCADPDNLPYSRADGAGFEIAIARVLAEELRRPLEVTWLPQARGFVRKSLGEGLCDALLGVPAGYGRVLATRPYYRSTYVLVTRADARAPLAPLDDARLASLAIGVQLVGDDPSTTPPGLVLARHGAVEHVVGYPVFGATPSAERATADVAAGRLDAAILWGPQAGWFAAHSPVALHVSPASPPVADADLRFDFAIAMGVRRGDEALRAALDGALARRARDIDAILDAWSVPRVPLDVHADGARIAAPVATAAGARR